MRDHLLLAVVGLLCIFGLVRPKVGVYGYVGFALMRPDVLAFSNPDNSYSLLIALSTLLGSTLHMGRVMRLFQNPFTIGLIILQIPIALSVFGAVRPDLSIPQYWLLLRIILMAMLIPIFIDSLEDLRRLILVMSLSLGVIGLKFGIFGFIHGGARITSGYDNGMLSGNNEVGMALAMILPLCYHSMELLSHRWQKVAMFGTSFSTAAAIVMTYSRGAALGLAAVALMTIRRSSRRTVSVVSIVVLIVPIVYFVGPSYIDRLNTIKTPTEESSAASRIEMSALAFRIWQDYPLLGVGYGRDNFRRIAPEYGYEGANIVVHNTYTQILVDCGILAFALYVSLLFGAIIWLGRSARKMSEMEPHFAVYPGALQTALIAFAITSTFGSRENFDLYYMLLMVTAAWYRIAQGMERGTAIPEHTNASIPMATTA